MLLPEEFKDRMKKLLGSEYEEFMLSYNKEKVQGLRINTLKLDVADKDRLPFKLDTVPSPLNELFYWVISAYCILYYLHNFEKEHMKNTYQILLQYIIFQNVFVYILFHIHLDKLFQYKPGCLPPILCH